MRLTLFLLIGTLVVGCGASAEPPRPPGPPPPGLEQALDDFEDVVQGAAAHQPDVRPDFKVTPAFGSGYDLWSWVVDPMFAADDPEHQLSRSQLATFVAYQVDYEIGNGGFSQLYYNLDAKLTDDAVGLLRDLGATRHADLLAQGNEIVAAFPRETTTRRAALDLLEPDRFAALEDAWYEGEELQVIVERFIRAHPDDFFT